MVERVLMNKKARISFKIALVFAFISVLSFMYLTGADEVKTLESGVQFNFVEDAGLFYNFSINASADSNTANITQINITFPAGFSLVNSTNGTNAFGVALNGTFIVNETGNLIVWGNLTHFAVNASDAKYFWINASVATPGSYNISVATLNATSITYTNISVKINDTTTPSSIAFESLTPANNSIVITSIAGNISAADNGNISSLTVWLYNASSALVNSSTNNSGLSSAYVRFNFTGHSAGTYFLNASVNDTYNNANLTGSLTRTIILATSSFEFNGTVRDENGVLLDNYTIVNLTIRNQNNWGIVGYAAVNANTSGWFNLTVPSQSTWLFEPTIIHRNSSTSTVDFRSKTIPTFPALMMRMLAGTTFYLTPAGTINITAVNSTGGRTTFQYQIKDTKLGYPIASEFANSVSEVIINVPRNRNYSVMIYPSQSMPVSFNWNNFTSTNSYNVTDSNGNNLSTYNSTIYTLHKQFNISMVMRRVSGFFNATNASGGQLLQVGQNWTNFTVIPYLIEPGNMIHSDYGDMPYNLSGVSGESDLHNLSNGFFNISLPGTVETSNTLLFASAVYNNSQNLSYYGGFRNISLGYATGAVLMNFTNISLLMGSADNVSMMRIDGVGGNVVIPTAKQSFNIVNASNSTLTSTGAHIELTLDYSAYGAFEFTWMTDVPQSQATAVFLLPMLNATGFKEANIFVNGGSGEGNDQYAPRRVGTTSVAQIATNNNFTVKPFSPQALDGTTGASISISLYISNSSCDVPNPASSCSLGGTSQNMATFNPMQAVMGGGKISFRMGMGGVLVHYVNVDMLASGPPDALFEDNSDVSESTSGGFGKIMKFGSQGPTIYDYVLVSMPYTEGSSSTTGINESANINISIPVFYDDNWNVIWNSSLNGSSAGAFSGNHSHYSTYASDWSALMNQTICTSANISLAVNINSSKPCAIDTSNNRIWMRLPHFSGTGASVTGNTISAASSSSSSSSSGGSGAASAWTTVYSLSESNLQEGYAKELKANQQVSLRIEGERHTVGVESVGSDSAIIVVASSPQKATLKTGETKKFEITNDSYYDIQVSLNSIKDQKANVTIKGIKEKVVVESDKKDSETAGEKQAGTGGEKAGESGAPGETGKGTNNAKTWVIIAVIIIIIVAILLAIRYFAGSKKGFDDKVRYRVSRR